MKFRKKPVVIEATQYDGTEECARRIGLDVTIVDVGVQTLEGFMRAEPGDWIITGVKGERYPCKPDIFAATYEPAETPATTRAADRAATLVRVRVHVPAGMCFLDICGHFTDSMPDDFDEEEWHDVADSIRAAIAREIAAAEREAKREALERAAAMVNGEGHEGLAIAIRALAAEEKRDAG